MNLISCQRCNGVAAINVYKWYIQPHILNDRHFLVHLPTSRIYDHTGIISSRKNCENPSSTLAEKRM